MAVRVLRAALPRAELSHEDAIGIIEYHLERNRIAKRSHHKTWKQKHKHVKFKPLL